MTELHRLSVFGSMDRYSSREEFSLAIKSDMTLWACGENQHKAALPGDTTDRDEFATGRKFPFEKSRGRCMIIPSAIRNDDYVYMWGRNDEKQQEMSEVHMKTSRNLPIIKVSLLRAAETFRDYNLEGAMRTYGRNYEGQLGTDGTWGKVVYSTWPAYLSLAESRLRIRLHNRDQRRWNLNGLRKLHIWQVICNGVVFMVCK